MSIEMGKEYETLEGKKVRILCVDGPEPNPVVGIIEGWDTVIQWNREGEYDRYNYRSAYNLRPVIKTFREEVWVNVYSFPVTHRVFFSTREGADKEADRSRMACVKVIIEGKEGDGLGDCSVPY